MVARTSLKYTTPLQQTKTSGHQWKQLNYKTCSRVSRNANWQRNIQRLSQLVHAHYILYVFMYMITSTNTYVWMIMHGKDVGVWREDTFGKIIQWSQFPELARKKTLQQGEHSGKAIHIFSLMMKISYKRICTGGIHLRSY